MEGVGALAPTSRPPAFETQTKGYFLREVFSEGLGPRGALSWQTSLVLVHQAVLSQSGGVDKSPGVCVRPAAAFKGRDSAVCCLVRFPACGGRTLVFVAVEELTRSLAGEVLGPQLPGSGAPWDSRT